jgi:hypothetical protein
MPGRCRRLRRLLLLPRLLLLLRISLRRRNRTTDPVARQLREEVLLRSRLLMARPLLALRLYLQSRRTARILVLAPRAR